MYDTEVKTEDDLFAPGSKPGQVPTDIEQATGLERLELLGKMRGIDVFDQRPLDASRKGMSSNADIYYQCPRMLMQSSFFLGTFEDPIIVNGGGDEQYAGCTGYPADSHVVNWLTVSLGLHNVSEINRLIDIARFLGNVPLNAAWSAVTLLSSITLDPRPMIMDVSTRAKSNSRRLNAKYSYVI